MNASPATEAPELSRRAIVAGAAWAVPVIVTVTAAPTFAAASNTPTVTATTPNMQSPAAGTVAVTATVEDSSGNALSGRVVSFTGPNGVSFSPTNPTTDGSGIATTAMTTTDAWALPGSTLTITALSGGVSGTATITQLGANAFVFGRNTFGAVPEGGSGKSATQLALVFPSPLVTLAGGDEFSYALLQDGTVWSIGLNGNGELGDGTTTDRTSWAKIPALSGVTQIAASGTGGGYALLNNGRVYAWGTGNRGRLGNGSTSDALTPVAVTGITTATQISSSFSTGYALLADGSVESWGSSANGALGNGTIGDKGGVDPNDASTPVTVTGITTATQIVAGGSFALALLSDATVRSWGANLVGSLGNGTNTAAGTPTTVSGISNAVRIAATSSTGFACLSDGTVKSWGSSYYGELGNGGTTNSNTPVTVNGLSGVTQITGGEFSVYTYLSDGTLRSWGRNDWGQLGNGNTTDSSTPVTVQGATNATLLPTNSCYTTNLFLVVGDRTVTFAPSPATVQAGSTLNLGVTVTTPSGTLLAGQSVTFSPSFGSVVPIGATTDSSGSASTSLTAGVTSSPTASPSWTTPGTIITTTARSAGASSSTSVAVLGANAYAVGSNDTGQTNTYGGAGTDSTSYMLMQPTQLSRVFPSPITQLVSALGFSLALLQDGTLWGVGDNDQGQLGDGTNTTRGQWGRIPGLADVVQIAAAARSVSAVTSDGSVWQWGQSLQGRGGKGTNTPLKVAGISTATQAAIAPDSGEGSAAYALLSDGTVVSWGAGALGDGTTQYRATPGPVSGVSNAVQIAASMGTAFALLSNGTIKSWGMNSAGANLGNGTNDAPDSESFTASPVTVSGITTATRIAAAGYSTYAILANGQVRAWGGNDAGQLGDGTTTARNTPVAVNNIDTATRLGTAYDSAYALLADGTALAWGGNDEGQLGDGTTTGRSTPAAFPGSAPGGAPQITGFSVNSSWKRAFAILA